MELPKNNNDKLPLATDMRIVYGLVATVFWLLLGVLYISNNVGWSEFVSLPIADMGSFLEGAFAPLAFLWLVLGLFIQQSVLAENNRELRDNNIQSEKQTMAIAATELNARQETFFKIADNTRRQLGGISGLLFQSGKGAQGDRHYTEAEFMEMWHLYATGDFEIFSRNFLALAGKGVDLQALFYGTQIRCTHTDNFIMNFDRLLRLARDCDTNGIISDAQLHSAHGLLSSRMRELHPRIKFKRYEVTRSSSYLEQVFKTAQEQG